jgi:hypothetical protein
MSDKLEKFVGELDTNDTIALAQLALSALQDADAITTVINWAKDEGNNLLDELQARVDEAVEKVDEAEEVEEEDEEGEAGEPEEDEEDDTK